MTYEELQVLQGLSLDLKIAKSKQRIREFIDKIGIDNVYVSFSGGKDSTVLSHLVKEVEEEYPEHKAIPLVFCNTGLEYPELVNFVKKQRDLVMIRPKLSFKEVIEKWGYPCVSKETSERIYAYRNYNISDERRKSLINSPNAYRRIPKKWQYLINADFEVNSMCCKVMKKRPFHKYAKETGRFPILGTMAQESRLRTQQYILGGGATPLKRVKLNQHP